jgi:hypothetical protein
LINPPINARCRRGAIRRYRIFMREQAEGRQKSQGKNEDKNSHLEHSTIWPDKSAPL